MNVSSSTIDTESAGGTGDVVPKRILGCEPMSVEDAEEHVERMLGWRTVLGRSDQASLALLREVRRLRVAVSELEVGYKNQRDRANEELVRIRGEQQLRSRKLEEITQGPPPIIVR